MSSEASLVPLLSSVNFTPAFADEGRQARASVIRIASVQYKTSSFSEIPSTVRMSAWLMRLRVESRVSRGKDTAILPCSSVSNCRLSRS